MIYVRQPTDAERAELKRMTRQEVGRGSQRAQMVLLSAQGMDVEQIAKVAFTSPDRVRDVINNFNDDAFDSLYPKYAGGRPRTFALPQRQQVKRIALSRSQDHGLPFSTWSLNKLVEFLVAKGVVDDISHEGLRDLLRKEGVSFQVIKTSKQSNDPDYEAKKNRVLDLYDIVDGKAEAGPGDPTVVICMDQCGPLTCCPGPASSEAGRGEQGQGLARLSPPPTQAGDLTAHSGRASPDGGARPGHRQDVRPREAQQEPHHVPGVLPLPALAVPARGPHRHRVGHLQPAPLRQKDQRVGEWPTANNVEL